MTGLPEKLSDLVELALRDCRAVEARDDVTWNMYEWVEDPNTPECTACVAGAVMLQTLGAPVDGPSTTDWVPEDYPMVPEAMRSLYALNDARQGKWRSALRCLTGGGICGAREETVAALSGDWPAGLTGPQNGEAWYAAMADAAKRLREVGL